MSRDEFTRPSWVLDQVTQDEMSAPTGETGTSQIVCRELLGELLDQPIEGHEGFEDLPVTAGLRTTSFDDVRPIGTMSTGGVEELSRFSCLTVRVC